MYTLDFKFVTRQLEVECNRVYFHGSNQYFPNIFCHNRKVTDPPELDPLLRSRPPEKWCFKAHIMTSLWILCTRGVEHICSLLQLVEPCLDLIRQKCIGT